MTATTQASAFPGRAVVQSELRRLRDEGERDFGGPVGFVGAECRVALDAYRGGRRSLRSRDGLATLNYARTIAETAIRLCWIAGDDYATDPCGRMALDAEAATYRAWRLIRRDLMHLASAYRAVATGDVQPTGYTFRILEEFSTLADHLDVDPAPAGIQSLVTGRTGRQLYALHRLCSAQMHPGALLGRWRLEFPGTLESDLDHAAYLCAAFGDACLRAVDAGPATPRVNV